MLWSPYTKRNIDKLERIQRKSDDPYNNRLMKLSLVSLEKRRLVIYVSSVCKVLKFFGPAKRRYYRIARKEFFPATWGWNVISVDVS